MAALMFCDDFQARADREPQQWDERILVPNAVHIIAACSSGQLPDSLVSAKQTFQNDGFYLLGGFYRLGCPSTGSPGVWSNVGANEPTAEPSEPDFGDRSVLPVLQGSRNRRQQDFIREAEVLQALAYTPRTLPGLPVELKRTESLCYRLGATIRGVQLRDEAQRPIGQNRISC